MADYFTKHHSPTHHIQMRSTYLHCAGDYLHCGRDSTKNFPSKYLQHASDSVQILPPLHKVKPIGSEGVLMYPPGANIPNGILLPIKLSQTDSRARSTSISPTRLSPTRARALPTGKGIKPIDSHKLN